MNIAIALTDGKIDPCDGEILMGYILKKGRSWIVAHPDVELSTEQKSTFKDIAERRKAGEPVAYIIGEKEFFGRSFHVDPSVLIPRSSTEGLVEMVLEILCRRVMVSPSNHDTDVSPFDELGVTHPIHSSIPLDAGIVGISKVWGPLSEIHTIVDVGTGSGCIAVTLACELQDITVVATDISPAALEIARMNAKRHGVGERILFLQGNLLEPIMDLRAPFLMIANPPYIPEGENLPIDITRYEPKIALRAGPDGLSVLRPLLAAARAHPACRGHVIECRRDQEQL